MVAHCNSPITVGQNFRSNKTITRYECEQSQVIPPVLIFELDNNGMLKMVQIRLTSEIFSSYILSLQKFP